jgi:hypothetical protein
MSTNMVVPAAPASRPSDDEILGLSTNGARKSGRSNLAKSAEGAQANTLSPAGVDAFFAGLEDQQGAGGELESDADADANETRNSNGPADQEKLNGVLEANPELRDAWRDAQAYREVFATPAEAQAATKLLGDLNRMDALFYSQRPEDHAELARSVAQLDPEAFASLARAMSSLASSAAAPSRPPAAVTQSRDGIANKNPGSTATPDLTVAQSAFLRWPGRRENSCRSRRRRATGSCARWSGRNGSRGGSRAARLRREKRGGTAIGIVTRMTCWTMRCRRFMARLLWVARSRA